MTRLSTILAGHNLAVARRAWSKAGQGFQIAEGLPSMNCVKVIYADQSTYQ
jgi:hypothetical protein